MQSNITYLFGAGASYNALPLDKNLHDQISKLAIRLEKNCTHLLSNISLIEDLHWLSEKSKSHETVDTYARKLHMHIITPHEVPVFYDSYKKVDLSNEYRRLKDTLSAYFILSQFERKEDRYNKLLSHVLHKERPSVLSMKENIRIATWNYDSQLEIAFADNYRNSTTKDVFGMLGSYPCPFLLGDSFYGHSDDFDPREYRTPVIHLNGIAGLTCNEQRSFEMSELINSRTFEDLVQSISNIYNSSNSFLFFGWDEENTSINLAYEEFQETDVLVVCGYSFPSFNKKVDYTIIESMKALKKIYIQDLTPENVKSKLEMLVSQTDIEYVLEKNVDSFLIPYELE
ncbi:MAG: hypothetical protein KI790_16565 [Cyclobacteriaceae bacterium]|nr:hypothetical protein [Cyclobacteriaceae bacterium HetDA_MAG_MS6]